MDAVTTQPQPTSPTVAVQTGAAASGDVALDTGSALSSDFETFLVMLTTQLQNQDPLNPLDSTDFAVQLATFSGVEQQVRTNDLLADVINGLGASGVAQLAGWVGLEARVDAPARFDGAPIRLSPDPDPASEQARLIVRDEFDRIVAQEDLPVTGEAILWAGTDARGRPLPSGTYSFAVESLIGGEVQSLKSVPHYAMVEEARQGAAGTEIVTSTGAVVAAADVTALRQP